MARLGWRPKLTIASLRRYSNHFFAPKARDIPRSTRGGPSMAPGVEWRLRSNHLFEPVILQRYLLREILAAFGAVYLLLLLIFVSRSLVDYLAKAAAGRMPVDIILHLLGLLVLSAMILLVPLCLFVAVMLALGRMQRDGELIAMTGAGLSRRYFHGSVARVAAAFAAVMAVFALYASPWAEREMKQLEARAKEESDLTGIAPGRFKEFSEGDRVLFVKELSEDRTEMREVFLQVRERGNLGVLAADGASLMTEDVTSNRFVVFTEGSRYEGTPGKADYQITQYDRFGVRLDREDREQSVGNTRAMTTSELLTENTPQNLAELQWRISTPISTFLLAVFAVVLTQTATRNGRYGSLLIAVLVYFTYSNTLGIARSMVKRGDLPGYLGLWWVHLLMLAAIIAIEFFPVWARRLQRGEKRQQLLPG